MLGRTGRFGRKGISVNFVHNQKTFQDMMTIQQTTGRAITKVETGDYDMMDEVSVSPSFFIDADVEPSL